VNGSGATFLPECPTVLPLAIALFYPGVVEDITALSEGLLDSPCALLFLLAIIIYINT